MASRTIFNDVDHGGLADADHAIDWLGEDALRALPDAAWAEDIDRAETFHKRLQSPDEGTTSQSKRADLRFNPGRSFLENAIMFEGLDDQRSSDWDELKKGAQDIDRARCDRREVDWIDAEHDGEEPEARNCIRPVGKSVEGLAKLGALNVRLSSLRNGGRNTALNGGALLDRVS